MRLRLHDPLEREDFEDAKQLAKLAAVINMTPGAIPRASAISPA
jgi:hypothetical protein